MARKRFYNLKRPKIRASWNKVNLYNLWRQEPLRTRFQTFFQQKWAAKSHSRGYHGEHMREKHWERQFSRYIPAVVPMDAEALAKSDGSDMAAGRGSGLVSRREALGGRGMGREKQATPYMQGVFWPQEKRLDVAVWRALFASSARQARQFVVHGFVKVNGKRMRYPGYLLNPGDMFSVDPEMVLFATGGRPKDTPVKGEEETEEDPEAKQQARAEQSERSAALRQLRTRIVNAIALEAPDELQAEGLHKLYLELLDTKNSVDLKDTVDDALARLNESAESDVDVSGDTVALVSEETVTERKRALQLLRSDIDTVLGKRKISGPRKRELRALYSEAGKALSRVRRFEDSNFIDDFRRRLNDIEGKIDASEKGLSTLPDGTVIDPSNPSQTIAQSEIGGASEQIDELEALKSRVMWARKEGLSSTQEKALDDILRRVETATSTVSNSSDLPDDSYDPQLLTARFIAIVGPNMYAESEKYASGGSSGSDALGSAAKRTKQFLSPHMERLSRLADFQNRAKIALSYVPFFQRKWAEDDAAVAATATTANASTNPSAPQTVAPPPVPTPSPSSNEQSQLKENSKPDPPAYLTPWRPRPYMPAFAFIPRYLEVNQNVCSAVYLRDPVVRPGLAEVPSPFAPETGQLVFNWYLRRR